MTHDYLGEDDLWHRGFYENRYASGDSVAQVLSEIQSDLKKQGEVAHFVLSNLTPHRFKITFHLDGVSHSVVFKDTSDYVSVEAYLVEVLTDKGRMPSPDSWIIISPPNNDANQQYASLEFALVSLERAVQQKHGYGGDIERILDQSDIGIAYTINGDRHVYYLEYAQLIGNVYEPERFA